jgi:hypothetical protein
VILAAISQALSASTGQQAEPRNTATVAPARSWSVLPPRMVDAETLGRFLEVGHVKGYQFGAPECAGKAE